MKPTELSCELLPGESPAGCHRRLLRPRPTPSYGRSPNLSPESRGTRRRGGRKRKWLAMAAVLLSAASWSPPGLGSPRPRAGGRSASLRSRGVPDRPPPSPAPASAFHPRHEPEAPELRPPHTEATRRRGAHGRNGFRPVFLTQLASAPTRFIVFQWPKLLLC